MFNFANPSCSIPFKASDGSGLNASQNDYFVDGVTATLDNDLIARDVILQGGTINTNGYRIYCRNLILVIKGGSQPSFIINKGADAVSGYAGGTGGAWGSLGGGTAGGVRGSNREEGITNPTNGGSVRLGSLGGSGGTGGDGTGGVQGGTGGLATANYAGSGLNLGSLSAPVQGITFTEGFFLGTPKPPASTTSLVSLYGGAGGGGGYPGTTVGSDGGNGGGGGGSILICAAGDIELDNGCQIIADGGNGSDGIVSDSGQGGGGGGGGGGVVLLTCKTLSISALNSAAIRAAGGSGGVSGTEFNYGQDGSSGKIWIKTSNGTFFREGIVLGSANPVFPIK